MKLQPISSANLSPYHQLKLNELIQANNNLDERLGKLENNGGIQNLLRSGGGGK